MTTAASAASVEPVQSFDPVAGKVWRHFEPATNEAVVASVRAARDAQRAWVRLPIRRRAALVERVRHVIFERRDALAELLEHETGKPPLEALFEVLLVADTAAWAARWGPRVLRPRTSRSWNPAMLRKVIRLEWEPFGVVGVISVWNYPLLLGSGSILPALVAGNAVVLKPSELTPSCGAALVDAVRAAGVPPDLVQCVQGGGAVGRALIEAGVDRVSFTGSEATGRRVAAACGERLIPCSLELGGSDPAIVLDDADPVVAAAGIVWARCANAGQTCIAAKRVIVQAGIYDRFMTELSRAVASLRVGTAAGRDVGPLIRSRQAGALSQQRADAVERGARVLVSTAPDAPSETAVAVDVLVDVDERMRVMREETFGPLLPVARVDSVDEAVDLANRTSYGLSASVWTGDARRGLAVARRIEAGTVMVNDAVIEAAMPEVAHGGVKGSGTGRLHGSFGFTNLAWPKTIVVDRFAHWKQAWWFPYTDRMREGLAAFFRLRHGRGVVSRLVSGARSVWLLYVRPGR